MSGYAVYSTSGYDSLENTGYETVNSEGYDAVQPEIFANGRYKVMPNGGYTVFENAGYEKVFLDACVQLLPELEPEFVRRRMKAALTESSSKGSGVANFTWSSIGGIMIGVGILAAGVIVMVSTGGAAAPAVFASVCTSMGTTGILHSTNKAINGEEVNWACYATETLVSGAITLGTFGVAKGLAVAKGFKEVAELSRLTKAGASAIAQGSATAIRNSAEGRNLCDKVLDTTIAAFVGGFVGSCVPGGASPASNSVGVSNAALAREFVAAVAAGGAAGGVGSTVSCATRNVIAGKNLFDNLDQAFLSGLQAGAIAGASHGAISTSNRIQQRALHNQMFAARRAEVGAGGVAGAFETLLWCEANGQTVIVIDKTDGGVHVYGPAAAHSSEPPIVLSYSAGTEYGASQGHYTRVNMDGSPVPTSITGAYSCLADALGVTPRDVAFAIQLNNGRAALHGMTDAKVHAIYGRHIGGSDLHVFETQMINNANARVREIAKQLTGTEFTHAQKKVLRIILAQELLNDRSPDAAENQARGCSYNDAIAPRSYSVEFSHEGINNQYAEDRTGTGFPYAGHDVEEVAANHAASSSDFRLGVFLVPERPSTLVSSNNRGLAFHALRNESVENVSYAGTGASNYATWDYNGRRPITNARFEQSGRRVDASNVRWGRRPTPG